MLKTVGILISDNCSDYLRFEIFCINIMEQVSFTGSMKNIPQGSREEYVMNFTHRMRILLAGMTWHAAFVLGILKPGKNKETYGFN